MPNYSTQILVDCKELVSAIDEIYASVENPALWPAVLDRIAALSAGERLVLFANYSNSDATNIQAFAGGDSRMWELYREHFASVNVWTKRCDRMFPAGAVRYSHQAIQDRELEKTEFHADFLKPHGIAYGFGVEIVLPGQPSALLSGLRSARRGPFEEKEGRILQQLLPHLQRALRLHFELTSLRSAKHGLEIALDAFDRAVFGVSGKGKVLFCNGAARQLVAESDGLRIKDHRIVAERTEQNAELQFLLKQAAVAGTGFSETGAVRIDRGSDKPALRLTLMPCANNLLAHIPQLAVLVFVDDPARKPLSRAATLRALFRLSPAEARLTDLLLQGLEVREAADRLGTTLETTRFHLKQVLAKTGTRRQTELMRLMLSLPGT